MSLKSNVLEFLKFDELKENFLKLLDAKFELKKLEITEQVEVKTVDAVYLIIKLLLILIIYILAIISISFLIGIYSEKPYLGFLIFIVIHLILLFIIISQKIKIKEMIALKIKDLFSKV